MLDITIAGFDMHAIPSSNFKRKKLGDYARHAESFMSANNEPFFLNVNYPDAHRPFTRQDLRSLSLVLALYDSSVGSQ